MCINIYIYIKNINNVNAGSNILVQQQRLIGNGNAMQDLKQVLKIDKFWTVCLYFCFVSKKKYYSAIASVLSNHSKMFTNQ